MKDILDFCIQHWRLIASGIIILLNLLILITRKKPVKVVDTFISQLYRIVINAVSVVEKKIGSGQGKEKKEMVIDIVKQAFQSEYGPSINMDAVLDLASKVIEEVLSTPQKKG